MQYYYSKVPLLWSRHLPFLNKSHNLRYPLVNQTQTPFKLSSNRIQTCGFATVQEKGKGVEYRRDDFRNNEGQSRKDMSKIEGWSRDYDREKGLSGPSQQIENPYNMLFGQVNPEDLWYDAPDEALTQKGKELKQKLKG